MSEKDVQPHEAIVLSRIIRDISVDELKFLLRSFAYKHVEVADEPPNEMHEDKLTVLRSSADGHCAIGLLSLGILGPSNLAFGGATTLVFSPTTAKLIALVRAHTS